MQVSSLSFSCNGFTEAILAAEQGNWIFRGNAPQEILKIGSVGEIRFEPASSSDKEFDHPREKRKMDCPTPVDRLRLSFEHRGSSQRFAPKFKMKTSARWLDAVMAFQMSPPVRTSRHIICTMGQGGIL